MNGVTYGYRYNERGDMLEGPDLTDPEHVGIRTIGHSEDGLPVMISNTRTNYTVEMEYDGQGGRAVKRMKDGGTTLYVGSHYEEKDGVITKHIFAGGIRMAKVSQGQVEYQHQDHLGSTSAVTDGMGRKIGSVEYMPFGTVHEKTGAVDMDHRYTDKEYDAETGLYYYGARYYDPMIARFVMADTIVPDITDTKALNSYAYCLNNPLIHIDPTGHYSKKISMGYFSGAGNGSIGWTIGAYIAGFVSQVIVTAAIFPLGPVGPMLGMAAGGLVGGLVAGSMISGFKDWQGTLISAGLNTAAALAGSVAGGVFGSLLYRAGLNAAGSMGDPRPQRSGNGGRWFRHRIWCRRYCLETLCPGCPDWFCHRLQRFIHWFIYGFRR